MFGKFQIKDEILRRESREMGISSKSFSYESSKVITVYFRRIEKYSLIFRWYVGIIVIWISLS
jgi:hypothetical protein